MKSNLILIREKSIFFKINKSSYTLTRDFLLLFSTTLANNLFNAGDCPSITLLFIIDIILFFIKETT